MKICAEEFFENAGIRQIRKMLTLYQRSESRNVEPEEIKAWLEDRITKETRWQKVYDTKRRNAQGELPAMEGTEEDIDRLKKAIASCKARIRYAVSGEHKAARLIVKYQSILSEMDKV
ncbi:MAG: hypothetical protein ACLSIP_07595 [Hungatella sp.]